MGVSLTQGYGDIYSTRAAFHKYFPPGTPKPVVDRFLIADMGMIDSVPWHLEDSPGGGHTDTEGPGTDHYNIYYLKNTTAKNGQLAGKYLSVRYDLRDRLIRLDTFGRIGPDMKASRVSVGFFILRKLGVIERPITKHGEKND